MRALLSSSFALKQELRAARSQQLHGPLFSFFAPKAQILWLPLSPRRQSKLSELSEDNAENMQLLYSHMTRSTRLRVSRDSVERRWLSPPDLQNVLRLRALHAGYQR